MLCISLYFCIVAIKAFYSIPFIFKLYEVNDFIVCVTFCCVNHPAALCSVSPTASSISTLIFHYIIVQKRKSSWNNVYFSCVVRPGVSQDQSFILQCFFSTFLFLCSDVGLCFCWSVGLNLILEPGPPCFIYESINCLHLSAFLLEFTRWWNLHSLSCPRILSVIKSPSFQSMMMHESLCVSVCLNVSNYAVLNLMNQRWMSFDLWRTLLLTHAYHTCIVITDPWSPDCSSDLILGSYLMVCK